MKDMAGIWVDHKDSVVVTFNGEEQIFTHFKSETYNHPHSNVHADDVRLSVMKEYLNRFYDSLITAVSAEKSIMILGPGEAKLELQKRFEELDHHHDKRLIVETAEKMTDPQLAAKVRKYFHFHVSESI